MTGVREEVDESDLGAVGKRGKLFAMADDGDNVGLIKALDAMPAKPATTIRFFRRGEDFYCTYQDDATFVAREFYKTMGVVKMLGPPTRQVPSVACSRSMFETIVRDLLLVRQYRVEMLENQGRGKNNDWVVVKKASPGNLLQFEDHIYSSSDVNSTSCMAVKVASEGGARKLGVAIVDTTRYWIGLCEFVDNDQFSTFETVVVQQGAKECLMAEAVDSPDGQKLAHIAERSRMLVSPRRKGNFSTKDINQDLDRLLMLPAGTNAAALPETEMVHAMGAAAALIDYLEILRDDTNFGKYTLERFDGSQYMKLDAAAVRALNLLPAPGSLGPKSASVVGVLDACQTPQGKRLLHQWVKQPLLDKARIEERLDLVAAFYDDAELRDAVMGALKRAPDLNRLSKKFLRGKGNLNDVVRVYDAAKGLPELVRGLDDYPGEHADAVRAVLADPIRQSIAEFSNFEGLVEAAIELDAPDSHTYLIKDTYKDSLGPVKEAMDSVLERIPDIRDAAIRSLGSDLAKNAKADHDDKHGYHLRVTRSNEKLLRSKRGLIILQTQKQGVKFTTDALLAANEEYIEATKEYKHLQQEIVDEVMKIVQGYCGPMEILNDRLAHVDVIASFGHVSVNAIVPYVRPTIRERGEGGIKLEGSRHPCVEVQDEVAFIANDVSLVPGESNFSIITGPNMGGKSTYIRQIGVNVLMAQIGCFVPCESASISIVDSILARVGAGDSQLKGVSTFMAEMLETASILKAATKDSLIIIDELGRGTSTYDGFGLAWAISEHICTKIGALCLFATHFHELTRLADEQPGVQNLHVKAVTTGGTLTLLYRVLAGACDQSFGIHVAELANFPDVVVSHAKRKASELEDFSPADATAETPELTAKKQRVVGEFTAKIRGFAPDTPVSTQIQELKELRKSLASELSEVGLAGPAPMAVE